MCEKPLAPNLSDAQRCVDVLGAQASNVLLAFNRRFDPGMLRSRRRSTAVKLAASSN